MADIVVTGFPIAENNRNVVSMLKKEIDHLKIKKYWINEITNFGPSHKKVTIAMPMVYEANMASKRIDKMSYRFQNGAYALAAHLERKSNSKNSSKPEPVPPNQSFSDPYNWYRDEGSDSQAGPPKGVQYHQHNDRPTQFDSGPPIQDIGFVDRGQIIKSRGFDNGPPRRDFNAVPVKNNDRNNGMSRMGNNDMQQVHDGGPTRPLKKLSNDPSELDLEIEILRKKRIIIEEERMLLLEKQKLEMVKAQQLGGVGIHNDPSEELIPSKNFGDPIGSKSIDPNLRPTPVVKQGPPSGDRTHRSRSSPQSKINTESRNQQDKREPKPRTSRRDASDSDYRRGSPEPKQTRYSGTEGPDRKARFDQRDPPASQYEANTRRFDAPGMEKSRFNSPDHEKARFGPEDHKAGRYRSPSPGKLRFGLADPKSLRYKSPSPRKALLEVPEHLQPPRFQENVVPFQQFQPMQFFPIVGPEFIQPQPPFYDPNVPGFHPPQFDEFGRVIPNEPIFQQPHWIVNEPPRFDMPNPAMPQFDGPPFPAPDYDGARPVGRGPSPPPPRRSPPRRIEFDDHYRPSRHEPKKDRVEPRYSNRDNERNSRDAPKDRHRNEGSPPRMSRFDSSFERSRVDHDRDRRGFPDRGSSSHGHPGMKRRPDDLDKSSRDMAMEKRPRPPNREPPRGRDHQSRRGDQVPLNAQTSTFQRTVVEIRREPPNVPAQPRSVKVAILPVEYPDVVFTTEQGKTIIKFVNEICNSGPYRPAILNVEYKSNGVVVYQCGSRSAGRFIINNISGKKCCGFVLMGIDNRFIKAPIRMHWLDGEVEETNKQTRNRLRTLMPNILWTYVVIKKEIVEETRRCERHLIRVINVPTDVYEKLRKVGFKIKDAKKLCEFQFDADLLAEAKKRALANIVNSKPSNGDKKSIPTKVDNKSKTKVDNKSKTKVDHKSKTKVDNKSETTVHDNCPDNSIVTLCDDDMESDALCLDESELEDY